MRGFPLEFGAVFFLRLKSSSPGRVARSPYNLPMTATLTAELIFSEDAARETIAFAVRLARRTTPGNVCDEACVQWTMEDVHGEDGWHSTLDPETISTDEGVSGEAGSFSEDELRALVSEAVAVARRTTPENVSDEACVQRVLREEFVSGLWRSSLRDPKRTLSAGESLHRRSLDEHIAAFASRFAE